MIKPSSETDSINSIEVTVFRKKKKIELEMSFENPEHPMFTEDRFNVTLEPSPNDSSDYEIPFDQRKVEVERAFKSKI